MSDLPPRITGDYARSSGIRAEKATFCPSDLAGFAATGISGCPGFSLLTDGWFTEMAIRRGSILDRERPEPLPGPEVLRGDSAAAVRVVEERGQRSLGRGRAGRRACRAAPTAPARPPAGGCWRHSWLSTGPTSTWRYGPTSSRASSQRSCMRDSPCRVCSPGSRGVGRNSAGREQVRAPIRP